MKDNLQELINKVILTVTLIKESDGSITGVIEELSLMTNAPTKESVIDQLSDIAIEYSKDYYNELEYWYSAPNRKTHLIYVIAIILHIKSVKQLFRYNEKR